MMETFIWTNFQMKLHCAGDRHVGGTEMAGRNTAGKNNWALFLMLLCGIVIGGFIGNLAGGTGAFGWLAYGQSFGLTQPIVLDLGILVLTFGLSIHINIAAILGVVIAAVIYHFL
jgi:hypothetical protein